MRGVSKADIVSEVAVFRVRASSDVVLGPLYWVRRVFSSRLINFQKRPAKKLDVGQR